MYRYWTGTEWTSAITANPAATPPPAGPGPAIPPGLEPQRSKVGWWAGGIAMSVAGALAAAGVAFAPVPPRYRSTYFQHVFAGGYSAGYYGYVWSEVLDADTVEWFAENGGLTRDNGDRFRRTVLARGGSLDAMDAFRELRGRDPEIGPLLARRGLDSAG